MQYTETKAHSKVILNPISELVGVTDTEVPHFPEIIKSAYEGTAVGHDLKPKVRESVNKNVETLAKVVRHAGGIPLLIELAVINDERMTHFLNVDNSKSSPKTGAFFVSDIISYGDTENGRHLFLDAWHKSIQRLADSKLHQAPQMIVPHPDTYMQGYVVQDLALIATQGLTEFLNAKFPLSLPEDWPEQKFISPSGNVQNLQSETSPVAELCGTNGCCVFRKKYNFELETKHSELEVPVERLTRGFIYYLLRDIEDRDPQQNIRNEKAAAILGALASFQILIVPFRRPVGDSRAAELGASARPGGCLFVVFRKSPNHDLDLELLSLRLSYVLSRAALSEAFSDIDLKEQRSKTLAVITHALNSRSLTIKGTLVRLRSLLDDTVTDESDKRDIAFAERAATSIVDLADVSRWFQKIKEGDMPPLAVSPLPNSTSVERELRQMIAGIWSDAKQLAPRRQEACDPARFPDPVLLANAWPKDMKILLTDTRYLSIVLSEVFTNVLRHGTELAKEPLRIDLTIEPRAAKFIMWLRLANHVTTNLKELKNIRERLAHSGGKIGMAVLLYATAAWGLPEPKFNLLDGEQDPLFVCEVPLGFATFAAVVANGH